MAHDKLVCLILLTALSSLCGSVYFPFGQDAGDSGLYWNQTKNPERYFYFPINILGHISTQMELGGERFGLEVLTTFAWITPFAQNPNLTSSFRWFRSTQLLGPDDKPWAGYEIKNLTRDCEFVEYLTVFMTWENMTYEGYPDNQVNTIQALLVVDISVTRRAYVIISYEDMNVVDTSGAYVSTDTDLVRVGPYMKDWIKMSTKDLLTTGNGRSVETNGFFLCAQLPPRTKYVNEQDISIEGRSVYNYSLNDRLFESSNVGSPGKWVFRVDQAQVEDDFSEPKPSILINDQQVNNGTHNAVLGQTLNVRCSVGLNNSFSYFSGLSLVCGGTETNTTGRELTTSVVIDQSSNQTSCQCLTREFSFSCVTSTTQFVINVLDVSPQISVIGRPLIQNGSSTWLGVGESIEVKCNADESAGNLINVVVECNGVSVKADGVQSSTELTVTRAMHQRTCSCYVDELPGLGMTSFTIKVADVNPRLTTTDRASIQNASSIGYTLGADVELTCHIDEMMREYANATLECNDVTYVAAGLESSHELTMARDAPHTTCVCYAQNFETFGTALVTINVEYPLTIAMYSANSMVGTVTVNNGEDVEFACSAEGTPTPGVTVSRVLSRDTLTGQNTQLNSNTKQFTTTETMSCEDTDVYRCDALNDDAVRQEITVLVNCPPTLFNLESSEPSATIQPNGQFHFVMSVICRPAPTSYTLVRSRSSLARVQRSASDKTIIDNYIAKFEEVNIKYGTITLDGFDSTVEEINFYTLTINNGLGAGLDIHLNATLDTGSAHSNIDGVGGIMFPFIAAAVAGGVIWVLVIATVYTYIRVQRAGVLAKKRKNKMKKGVDSNNNAMQMIQDPRVWRTRIAY